MNKFIFIALAITLAVAVIVNITEKDEPTIQREYVVKNGDTLYSIAAEHGINDWQKWAYEVCENNDVKQGGLIYPGQIITIEVAK